MYFFQDDIGILIQLNSLPFFQYILTPWSAYFLPIFRFISFLEFHLFGLNFLPYLIVSLFFHTLNIFLIGQLAFIFTKNKFFMFLAMALFSFNLTYTEPLLWFTVQPLTLAVFFLGLSFRYWYKYLETGKLNYISVNIILSLLSG